MNRKSRISFGPGAASLILIVVILSMSVLGILALMNASSGQKLSRRSVEVIAADYELYDRAEKSLATLDAVAAEYAQSAGDMEEYLESVRKNLPAGMSLDEQMVNWTETDGYRTLTCQVELLPLGGAQRWQWRMHRLTAVTEDIWN